MRFAWIEERPFNYFDYSAERPGLVGCDVSLAQAAFARIGEDFEPVRTTFAELLPGLAQGRWDVTTGMFITPERKKLASFTRPIWSLGDGILVPSTAASTVSGYQSLAASGARLAVLRDQVQVENALTNGFTANHVVIYEDYGEAVDAVVRGEVGGYASVELAHREHLAAHPNGDLAVVAVSADETPPSLGAFACATRQIRNRVNAVLDGLLGSNPPTEPSGDPSSWAR